MSKLRYFIQKHITISEFAKVLAIPSLDVELDDSPTNFYPYFRLTLGTTKMVARTNVHGHVVKLMPISADTDGHRKIAAIIAELFDTEIEIEDFSKWGIGDHLGTEIRGVRKNMGIPMIKDRVLPIASMQ